MGANSLQHCVCRRPRSEYHSKNARRHPPLSTFWTVVNEGMLREDFRQEERTRSAMPESFLEGGIKPPVGFEQRHRPRDASRL